MGIPVVAIGGIDRGNFRAVVETGVSSVAMIRALVAAPDISADAKWFVEEFEKNAARKNFIIGRRA